MIEFNKDAKRIILSHSRIFEDVAKAEERAEKKAASGAKKSSNNKREDAPMIQNQAASTTLGDIDALAALKNSWKERNNRYFYIMEKRSGCRGAFFVLP